MIHNYVNRTSRPDRNFLWRGAMAAQGVSPEEMHRHIAMDKDDFPDAGAICEAASEDGFPGFFDFHKDNPQPHIGFGHLICSWSVMRMWRHIAEEPSTQGRQFAWLDDYALRVRAPEVHHLIAQTEPDILQLAWHTRNDLFYEDHYGIGKTWNVPRQLETYEDVYHGAIGCSDWALVLTRTGAAELLDYMANEPLLNTECAIAGLGADRNIPGLYSVVYNHPRSNGLKPIFGNRWVLQLCAYTDGASSDLLGLHEKK